MNISLSKHVRLKLDVLATHKIKVKETDIKRVLNNPGFQDYSSWPEILAIGALDKQHSLIVIYRRENNHLFVITLWPAAKGRYESKIQ